jgi:hypothetical protein
MEPFSRCITEARLKVQLRVPRAADCSRQAGRIEKADDGGWKIAIVNPLSSILDRNVVDESFSAAC